MNGTSHTMHQGRYCSLCHGPYRIPILYLEILLPVIRGGGKVKNMYHFSEGKKESETST